MATSPFKKRTECLENFHALTTGQLAEPAQNAYLPSEDRSPARWVKRTLRPAAAILPACGSLYSSGDPLCNVELVTTTSTRPFTLRGASANGPGEYAIAVRSSTRGQLSARVSADQAVAQHPCRCQPCCCGRRHATRAGRSLDVLCTVCFWLLLLPYVACMVPTLIDLYRSALCVPDCVRIERLDLTSLCSSQVELTMRASLDWVAGAAAEVQRGRFRVLLKDSATLLMSAGSRVYESVGSVRVSL
jgi:hypothetical protein